MATVPTISVKAPNPTVTASWTTSGYNATVTVKATNADLLVVKVLQILQSGSTTTAKTLKQTTLAISGTGTFTYTVTGPGWFRVQAEAYAYTEYYTGQVAGGTFGPLKIQASGMYASTTKDVFISKEYKCNVKLKSSTVELPQGEACLNITYTGYSKIKVVGGFSGAGQETIEPVPPSQPAYIANGVPWYEVEACFSPPDKEGTYTLNVTVYGYRADKGTWEQCYSGSFTVTATAKVSASLVTSWSVSVPTVEPGAQGKAQVTVNWNVASGATPYFKATLTLNGKSYSAQAQAFKSPFVFSVPFTAPAEPGSYNATVELDIGGGSMSWITVGTKSVTINVVPSSSEVSSGTSWSFTVSPQTVSPGGQIEVDVSISKGYTGYYKVSVSAFGQTFTSNSTLIKTFPATIKFPVTVPSSVTPNKTYTVSVTLEYEPPKQLPTPT